MHGDAVVSQNDIKSAARGSVISRWQSRGDGRMCDTDAHRFVSTSLRKDASTTKADARILGGERAYTG